MTAGREALNQFRDSVSPALVCDSAGGGDTRMTTTDFALSAETLFGLPEGITVKRDEYALPRLVWLVHDRVTSLSMLVTVDPDDHMVPWEPPAERPRWKRWLSPFGSALEAVDRARLIERMKGTEVVDWNAVTAESRKRGGEAVQRLLAARETEATS